MLKPSTPKADPAPPGSRQAPHTARPLTILYHHRTAAADGQRVHIDAIIESLRAAGHKVVVAAPRLSAAKAEGPPGPLNRLLGTLRRRAPGWVGEILELAYNLPAAWRLWRLWRRHRPDILYERYNLFLLAGTWLARRKRLPLLMEINAPLADERAAHGGLSLRGLARRLEQQTWRRASHCLPVSTPLAERVRAAGVAEQRITTIPNGTDADLFHPASHPSPVRRALGLQDALVIGLAGYIRPWHGLDRLIRLLTDPAMPDHAHLLVVGDGPAIPAARQLAEKLGVSPRLTVTGVQPRSAMPDYVRAFDIAAQPTVLPYASPLKLMEYMAAGLAIVEPDQANIRDVLRHESTALLFPPDHMKSFDLAVLRLAADANLRRSLGMAARAHLLTAGFTWRDNGARIARLAEQAMRVQAPQGTPPRNESQA
ncbi:glycosyltransferase family 4 protein [Yunchengibacter salinarum]|uniref:glycosyltransferase family 4 protein n=1 Tax=Yunchengibacter salinarum TaxID=3133399 RepID=UPI0035B5D71D